MTSFECRELTDSSVMMMYLERDRIFLEPPYQRASGIWNLEKKQLLIDSLINGYDIPKLYLHEYERATRHDGKWYKHAIIDGKQRLLAIWEFMNEGGYPLSDDIQYLRDPKVKLGGLKYEDLSREHSTIHARFTGRILSVIAIRTDDTDLVEDMFSRLNEAVPLNAPEKRNAFGGPLPPAIRKIVQTKFFAEKVSISKARYRHHDLACKFLYLEEKNGSADTKKSSLDEFVRDFARRKLRKKADALRSVVDGVLSDMNAFFKDKDRLLGSPGMAVVYYLLFRELKRKGRAPSTIGVTRTRLQAFEKMVAENRRVAEQDITKANPELLEFDRLSQSPNDASAIEYRIRILKKYLPRMKGS